jgi:hypothetical protein
LCPNTEGGAKAWEALVAAFKGIMLPTPKQLVQKHLEEFLETVDEKVRSRLLHCVLRPGDTIFIPCNYYHATINLEDTVAIGGQTGDVDWRGQSCPTDQFGAATQRFMTGGLAAVTEACKLNPYQLQCVLTRSSLLVRSGDAAGAVTAITAAAKKYKALVEEGVLPSFGGSIALGALAGQLAKVPALQQQPGAMQLAGKLVHVALSLFPPPLSNQPGVLQLAGRLVHVALLSLPPPP